MRKSKSNNPTNTTPLVLVLAGTVLLVGAALLLLAQNQPASNSETLAAALPTLSLEQIERVSIDQAKKAAEAREAVILDVRSADSYATEHITGAVNIPIDELEAGASRLNKDDWIIPYCT